jgi:chromosome segregation ATPase
MEDAVEFIQSRPLIGYQMDGSHLNNVLVSLARQQQHLMDAQNQLNNRLGDIAEDVREIRDHQRQLESVIGELGGPEQLHHVRSRISDVERALDGASRDIQEVKSIATAAGQDADQAGRLADDANRAAAALRDTINKLGSDVDGVARQVELDRKSIGKALGDLDKDRSELEQQMREALRDVQQRAERIERETGVDRLRHMLEELSERTDENFRSVEESARAVDAELSRQNANHATLRSEVAALDERARTGLAALSSDTDNKYHMLLDAFRQYETGWTELEEHMVRAGQMLANRKQRSPGRTSVQR